MEKERKPGKLSDLNRLLRTGDASAFQLVVGDPAWLVVGALCDHAGHGHAIAAGVSPANWRAAWPTR